MNSATDLTIGLAGEHLVCCDLLSRGFAAFLAPQNCQYDIVAQIGKKLVRIQVKTCKAARRLPQRKCGTMAYTFAPRQGKKGRRTYSKGMFELIAFVGLDARKIAYFKIGRVPQCLHLSDKPCGNGRIRLFDQFPLEKCIGSGK